MSPESTALVDAYGEAAANYAYAQEREFSDTWNDYERKLNEARKLLEEHIAKLEGKA